MSSKSDETATRSTTPTDTLVTPTILSEEKAEETKKPFSIYTNREKWLIVLIASFAGLFSTLTVNIYLPAIPAMAAAFHKSTELINITVTVYMAFQGISPMFWGTMADRVGRRPVFIACLLVLSLACVGLALVPTDAYWLLVLLRCLQAAGSASIIALGAGVIGDISESFERGGFVGLYSLGPMVGPVLGPVLGGLLADNLGWRAIFWFLCIASAVCALTLVLFLPETLRALVGDGSYTPSAIYRPLLPIIGRHRPVAGDVEKPPKKPFINPFMLFTYPDIVVILIFNGIVYSVFYSVIATISVLFKQAYPYLNEFDIGLCFLAIGGGMIIAGPVIGKLLDRDYESFKNKMIKKVNEGGGENGMCAEDVTKEENFPIELVRLRTMPIFLGIFCMATIGYGWCLQAKVSIAVPLILHICMGFVLTAVMNTSQTLIVDLMPAQGSSVAACNNFVRCSLGAALVAVINIIDDALRPGWTYVLLGGVCVLSAPLLYVSMRIGPKCRAKRRNEKALVASQV
ncbi:MFS general substrate transporter [Athelia psychrophila]|uniref:MFS general substrate transporter n=1 Tax=Athelia psychrophila TaxID=1759441 RepID=A0A166KM52_9AGAM|nr:MFS general substrate transporter [Fibularhizoctonia sp. CBS 109695]